MFATQVTELLFPKNIKKRQAMEKWAKDMNRQFMGKNYNGH